MDGIPQHGNPQHGNPQHGNPQHGNPSMEIFRDTSAGKP
jgi:hypothetical protein